MAPGLNEKLALLQAYYEQLVEDIPEYKKCTNKLEARVDQLEKEQKRLWSRYDLVYKLSSKSANNVRRISDLEKGQNKLNERLKNYDEISSFYEDIQKSVQRTVLKYFIIGAVVIGFVAAIVISVIWRISL
jgi:predicted nuclease with TOPRIM domain